MKMREILFRGRDFNGKWIYGYYCHQFPRHSAFGQQMTEYDVEYHLIITKKGRRFVVNPDTIGQYIGMTDKNSKKIFEGDIIITPQFNTPNKKYVVKYITNIATFAGVDLLNDSYFTTFDCDSEMFEVIGNIYDNPELLGWGESNA